MKKGISAWAFGTMPYAEIFRLAKEHGFEGVEPVLESCGELSLESTKEDILKIKKSAEENGIELYSLATGLYWQYALSAADVDNRQHAFEIAEKQIEVAALLGCDTILIIPGLVGSNAPDPYGEVDKRAEEAIHTLLPLAKKYNITLGVENVWNGHLLSPIEMNSFINRFNDPLVGAYFDVGNVLQHGYPQHWIDLLGDKIKKVHFKDYKKSIATIEGFCDLLAGDVDYFAVMQSLAKIGYDGWVTAEVFPYKSHNEIMLCHTSLAMDTILGRK